MSKTFRPYAPRQAFLLPQSPHEWLPAGHLAHFVLDVVDALDLRSIYAKYDEELRGAPPHHPKLMVALLLYGYAVGVGSSRKIEQKTYEDVAFRVIAGGQHPDHTRISEFRRIHLTTLEGLFLQILKLCEAAGLVKLGHVAIDGTKMKANASKHKAMSYERMKRREAELEAQVKELFARAEATDAAEDAEFGPGNLGNELPEELRFREKRLAKIQEAKAALEAEARRQKEEETKAKRPEAEEAEAKEQGAKGESPLPTECAGATEAKGGAKTTARREPTPLPTHRVPAYADGTPKPKAQRNFTDPESRIQKTGDGFVQGYNCTIAVDSAHQIIVAQVVTNQPPDVEHFVPVLEQVMANCGRAPEVVSADAGYYSSANVNDAEQMGVDPYIPPGRPKRTTAPEQPITERPGSPAKQRMKEKLATPEGAAIYARRKAIVEPVFGQTKQAQGFRQFLLRGVAKVRGEWALICLTRNLLKLKLNGGLAQVGA